MNTLTLLSLLPLTLANKVTFQSLDSTTRTIYFTANEGLGLTAMDPLTVPGGASAEAMFVNGWVGNWYSISEGASKTDPGMLGEVAFNGWNDLNYFDVSAIVDASDHDGVKQIYPAGSKSPISGCEIFPCDNAYYLPDDVQTKSTQESHLICTLGGDGSSDSADSGSDPSSTASDTSMSSPMPSSTSAETPTPTLTSYAARTPATTPSSGAKPAEHRFRERRSVRQVIKKEEDHPRFVRDFVLGRWAKRN